MSMITTFKQLKEKYSNLDLVKEDESKIMIDDFFFREDGGISMCRTGMSLAGDFFSVSTEIAKNRTPEQMNMFIQAIL